LLFLAGKWMTSMSSVPPMNKFVAISLNSAFGSYDIDISP